MEDVQLASLKVSLENYDLNKYIELFSQAKLTIIKGTIYAKYLHILGFLFFAQIVLNIISCASYLVGTQKKCACNRNQTEIIIKKLMVSMDVMVSLKEKANE